MVCMNQSPPCPRCGRPLAAAGEILVGQAVLPAYQCDVCTVLWDLGDADGPVTAAATFAELVDGRLVAFSQPDIA